MFLKKYMGLVDSAWECIRKCRSARYEYAGIRVSESINQSIYIYIYIYICVCVFVCVYLYLYKI